MGDPFGSLLPQNYGLRTQQGKPVPMSSARGRGGGGGAAAAVGSSGVGAANGRSGGGGMFGGGSSAMAGSSYGGSSGGGSRATAAGYMSGTPMRGGARGGGFSSLGGAQDDVFASLNNGGVSSGRSSPNNNDVFATLGNLSAGAGGGSSGGYGGTKTPPMRSTASGDGGGGRSMGAGLDDMLESITRRGGGGGEGGGRGGARKPSASASSTAAYGIDDLFGSAAGSSSSSNNNKPNSGGSSADDLLWGLGGGVPPGGGGGGLGGTGTSSGEKVGGRSPSRPSAPAGGGADDVADLLGGFGKSETRSPGVASEPKASSTKSSGARSTEDKAGDPLVSLDGETDSGGGGGVGGTAAGFATPATEFDDPFEGLKVPATSGSPPSSAHAAGADGAPPTGRGGAGDAGSGGHPSSAPSATGIEGFEDFTPPMPQPAPSGAEAAGPRGTGGGAAAGGGGGGGNDSSMPAQSRQAGGSGGDRGAEGEDGPNPTVSGANVDSASASVPPSGAATGASAATAAERRTTPEDGTAPGGSKEAPRPARDDERPHSAPSQGQPPTAGGNSAAEHARAYGRDTSPMPNVAPEGQRGAPGAAAAAAAAPPGSARAAAKDAPPGGREKMKSAETRSGVPPPVATNMGTAAADSGRGGGFGFPEDPAPSMSPTFKEWVTIKDIKLKSRPCTLPPPSRPPPAVPSPMGYQRASPVFTSNPSASPNPQRPSDPVVRLRSSSTDTQQAQPAPEEPRLRRPHVYEPPPVFPRAGRQTASSQPPPRYDSPSSSTGAGRPRWGPAQQDGSGSGGGGASARASASSSSSSSSASKDDARAAGEPEDPIVAQVRRAMAGAQSSAQSSPERTASGKEEDAARAAAAQSSAEMARAAKKAQEKMRAEMAAKEEAASRQQPRPSPSPSPSPSEQRASDSGNFFGQSNAAGRSSKPKPRAPTERDFMGAAERPPMTSVDDLANLGKKKKAPPAQPGGWVDMSAEDMWGPDIGGGSVAEDPNEPAERRAYRSERDRRVEERAAEALAEKNRRDMEMQREQEARHLADEELGGEIKRWAANKEGNLRALLSTLQDVLWPGCGWVPVSITDLINAGAVKKYYRKAALCVHPDKVQQKGATVRQKYVAEKVFDLLKEAWNKFNSEELF